jgi:hypothetical protein
MQARKITLIEIGAGALPSITPVPVRQSSWFPTVYVSPDVPPVEGVVPNPVADGVLIEWDAVDQEGVIYIIERGPTPDGPWMEIARVVETRYLYSDGSGQEWWFKITASVRGKPGEGAIIPVKPPPTAQEIIDLIAEQNRLGQEMADGFSEQAAEIANLQAALAAAEYDPETAYDPGVVVKWQGGLYVALVETLGHAPSDGNFWQKIGDYNSLAEAVGGQALVISAHETRIEQTEDSLAIVAEQAAAVAAALPGKAEATAVDALASRVEETEDGLAANSQAIQDANTAIAGKASSGALNALSSTVQQQGASIEANATGLNSVRAQLGGGGNLVKNASFETSILGWSLASNQWGSTAQVTRNLAGDDWRPPGICTLGFFGGGIPTGNIVAQSDPIPVAEGQLYLPSVYTAAHRCTAFARIVFTDANRTEIGNGAPLPSNPGTYGGGRLMAQWLRSAVAPVAAPAGARFARLQFWAVNASAADPYAWFMRPMLEQVRTADALPSLWADSSVGIDEKYSQVTQAIEARTTVNENGIAEYRASWTMSLDANGRVAGIRSVNNGTTSTIDFLFDRVRFVSPGNGRRMEYSDGHFLGYDENNVRRIRLGTWSA